MREQLKVDPDDEDGSIIIGLINDEFIESSDEEGEDEGEQQHAKNSEIMDAVLYVDEAFDEDFDDSLEILPQLNAMVDSEQRQASISSLPGSDVMVSELTCQQTDSGTRTVSTSPMTTLSVDDHRSVPDTSEVGATEASAPPALQRTTSVAMEALFNLSERGREQVELELASHGVLVQHHDEHQRIMLIEQVEVRSNSSDSDSENEAVVLTAAPADDNVANTRAQASIWLSISRYWANGSWRADSAVVGGSSLEPRRSTSTERHDRDEPDDRRVARRDERERSHSPDRHDFTHAVHGALQMALSRTQKK